MRKSISVIMTFFIVLFFSTIVFSQSYSKVRKVVSNSAEEIFTIYHSASSFENSKITIKNIDSGLKAYLTINYSGWFNKHRMKLAIYFDEDGPNRVKLISDTNFNKTFLRRKANKALTILQDYWEEIH